MNVRKRWRTVAGLGLLMASLPFAETAWGADEAEGLVEPDFAGRIGAGAQFEPTYPGSRRLELEPLADLDLKYKNLLFLDSEDGFGAFLYRDDRFYIGPSLFYRAGRSRSDGPLVDDLKPIPFAAQARLSTEYRFDYVYVGGALTQDIGGSDGATLELRLGTVLPLGESAFIAPMLRTTLGDDRYMQAWYGVSSENGPGQKTYDAPAGFESVTLEVDVGYNLTPNWLVFGRVEIEQLLPNAADSPVVDSSTVPTFGLGLSYVFP